MSVAAGLATSRPRTAWTVAGDWPRTTRLLPWAAAVCICVLFLVPIDSVTLGIPLPFDARPDRFALLACFGLWAMAVAVTPTRPGPDGAHRFGLIDVAVFAVFAVSVLSVVLDLPLLQAQAQADLASKKIVLLLSYLAFYAFVVGVVRPTEIPAFVRLVVGCAALVGLATIIEYATHFRLLFWLTEHLAPPGTNVASGDIVIPGGRLDVTGASRHGLADSTFLASMLPFAVVGAIESRSDRERWLFRIAAALIFVGSVATLRRTGIVLPFLACSAVVLLGGRRMLPVAAAFVVLLIATPIVAPGFASQLRQQFSSSNTSAQLSIQGRTSDFSEVAPDVRAKPWFGRGFGSYDAKRYRFLDDQYLTSVIETGFVGTAVYLALLLGAAGLALRTGLSSRGRRPAQAASAGAARSVSWVGLAAFGSILAFIVANALFDALAFPQAPYAFFLVLALVAVASQGHPAQAPQT